MKRAKWICKTFGTALAIVLAVAMLGGFLATPFPLTKFANQSQVLADVAPELAWNKTFGGLLEDRGWSVQQTSDGGSVTAGFTSSSDTASIDVYLVKTDYAGNATWRKTFGGSGDDRGYSVQQTSDGGYIIVGQTGPVGGTTDVYLIKTNPSGKMTWSTTFGGTEDDWGEWVCQTSDGGYIITGMTRSYGAGGFDLWLIKTNAKGKKQWDKRFGGAYGDHGYCVCQTSDGGYIVVGRTYSYEDWTAADIWLIKTDSAGNEQWNRKFDGGGADCGHEVRQTSDGGYIIAGFMWTATAEDMWVIKTDSGGNKQWDKVFGTPMLDNARSVIQTKDGGYAIVGCYAWSYETGQYGDIWLVKLDANGNKQWDETFGGAKEEVGESVFETSDGGYIIAGSTYSYGAGDADVWLIKAMPLKNWTFLVYMDGDNDLEGSMIKGLNEMEVVGSSPAVNVVVMLDRGTTKPDDKSNGDWKTTRLYYVTKDTDTKKIGSQLVEDLDELDMGANETLRMFINKVTTLYPAERYALVISSHGLGWRGVGGTDETDGRHLLEMPALKEALTKAGVHFDVLAFEACLMGMVEVAYQLPLVDIMVGSEEDMYAEYDKWGRCLSHNLPYDTILAELTGSPGMDGTSLAHTLVERFRVEHDGTDTDVDTISAIDLRGENITNLAASVSQFAELLADGLSSHYNEIKEARNQTLQFKGYNAYVDLYHFAELIGKTVSDVDIAVQAGVVTANIAYIIRDEDEWAEYENAHGVSIYFPQSGIVIADYAKLDFAADTLWDEFLSAFLAH